MNNVKFKTPGNGSILIVKAKQNAPRFGFRDQKIYTAAAIIARMCRRGFIACGVRQK